MWYSSNTLKQSTNIFKEKVLLWIGYFYQSPNAGHTLSQKPLPKVMKIDTSKTRSVHTKFDAAVVINTGRGTCRLQCAWRAARWGGCQLVQHEDLSWGLFFCLSWSPTGRVRSEFGMLWGANGWFLAPILRCPYLGSFGIHAMQMVPDSWQGLDVPILTLWWCESTPRGLSCFSSPA